MLIGYRCKVCGAPVDPETGYCHYCDTLNFKPIIRKPIKDERPRIIVRDGDEEAEIKPSGLSLTLEDAVSINPGRSIDGKMLPLRHNQYARFSASTYLTIKAIGILTKPVFDVVFTGFRQGYAHEFKAYSENIETIFAVNEIVETTFDIVSVNPVDLWNTRRIHDPILEGMKCPICGADLDPEKSKCDYCGYWWIYSPDG